MYFIKKRMWSNPISQRSNIKSNLTIFSMIIKFAKRIKIKIKPKRNEMNRAKLNIEIKQE